MNFQIAGLVLAVATARVYGVVLAKTFLEMDRLCPRHSQKG